MYFTKSIAGIYHAALLMHRHVLMLRGKAMAARSHIAAAFLLSLPALL